VTGVRKAGATAKEATHVAKEVSEKVAHRAEVTAEELSNTVVTSLRNVNKKASEEFVRFRDNKLKALPCQRALGVPHPASSKTKN